MNGIFLFDIGINLKHSPLSFLPPLFIISFIPQLFVCLFVCYRCSYLLKAASQNTAKVKQRRGNTRDRRKCGFAADSVDFPFSPALRLHYSVYQDDTV